MAGQAPEPMTVLARLELLDSQYRQLRRNTIIALIFLAILVAILTVGVLQGKGAAAGPAQEVALRDSRGKQRAWLGLVNDVPSLEFYDEDGKLLGGLKMSKGESGFLVFDDNQKLRGTFGLIHGSPTLLLYDGKERPLVNLALTETGSGLVLRDEATRVRVALGLGKTGPHLILKDDKGKIVYSKP